MVASLVGFAGAGRHDDHRRGRRDPRPSCAGCATPACHLAQGYHLARPGEPWPELDRTGGPRCSWSDLIEAVTGRGSRSRLARTRSVSEAVRPRGRGALRPRRRDALGVPRERRPAAVPGRSGACGRCSTACGAMPASPVATFRDRRDRSTSPTCATTPATSRPSPAWRRRFFSPINGRREGGRSVERGVARRPSGPRVMPRGRPLRRAARPPARDDSPPNRSSPCAGLGRRSARCSSAATPESTLWRRSCLPRPASSPGTAVGRWSSAPAPAAPFWHRPLSSRPLSRGPGPRSTPTDLVRLAELLEPLTSCYSSGEATGLAFTGGESLPPGRRVCGTRGRAPRCRPSPHRACSCSPTAGPSPSAPTSSSRSELLAAVAGQLPGERRARHGHRATEPHQAP